MRRYVLFAVASLVNLLFSISATSVAVAFPTIIESFDTSLVVAAWIISAFQLALVVVTPLAGKASDAFGRKFIYVGCLGLFTAGSVLCAIAPNVEMLIVFRIIQGIGAAGFVPSAVAVVADEFPASRQRVVGLVTSIFPLGGLIGPVVGGLLTNAWGWRSVFWINVPMAIVALIAVVVLMPSQKRGQSRIDLPGAVLLAGCLLGLMAALTLTKDATGSTWMLVGLLLGSSVVSGIMFFRREARTKDPIIELEVLRGRPFLATNIFNFMFGACSIGISAFFPLYAVSVYGMSTVGSGLILTPWSIGVLVAAVTTSFLLVRWGYRRPILIGVAAMILVYIVLSIQPAGIDLFGMHVSSIALLLGAMLLLGLGGGTVIPASNNACIELMPEKVATISAIRVMFRQAGGAISVAITSLVLSGAGSMSQGFFVVFLALAIVMFLSVPAVFAMPSSPKTVPAVSKTGAD